MNKYLFILLTLSMSFTNTSNDPEDRIGVPGPLTFNKTTFNISWTDKPTDTYYIQEYLPAGENIEKFHQMLTLHLNDRDIELKDVVKQKVDELNNRKKTDPTCNFRVNENPGAKEFMLDFILGESHGDKMTIVEFNIYRYKQVDLDDKKKGILVYAYSKRAYSDEITPFYKKLKNERTDLLNAMINSEIPAVKIAGK